MKAVKMGACNTQVDSTQQLHSVTRITLHKTLKKQGGILSFVRVISIIMMHRRLTLICARVRIEIHIGLASWGQSAAGAAYLPCTSKMEGARHWRYDRIVYPAVSVSVSVLQRAHRISQSVVHMLPKKQKHVLSPS